MYFCIVPVKVCALKVVQACWVGVWCRFETVQPPACALTPISSWPRNLCSETRHVCWVISGAGVGVTDFQQRALCNQRTVNDYHVLSVMPCLFSHHSHIYPCCSQWRTGGVVWGAQSLPPKFRTPSKIVSNSTRLWKLLKVAEFRTPTP